MGGQLVEIDFTLLKQVSDMLYESALVAERYACMQSFYDRLPASVIEPVHTIFENGKKYSGAEVLVAQQKLKRSFCFAIVSRLSPIS